MLKVALKEKNKQSFLCHTISINMTTSQYCEYIKKLPLDYAVGTRVFFENEYGMWGKNVRKR